MGPLLGQGKLLFINIYFSIYFCLHIIHHNGTFFKDAILVLTHSESIHTEISTEWIDLKNKAKRKRNNFT